MSTDELIKLATSVMSLLTAVIALSLLTAVIALLSARNALITSKRFRAGTRKRKRKARNV